MTQDLQQPRVPHIVSNGGKDKDGTLPAEGDAAQVGHECILIQPVNNSLVTLRDYYSGA